MFRQWSTTAVTQSYLWKIALSHSYKKMPDFIFFLTSYPAPCLLNMLVSGIDAKQSSNGNKESPWNIPR